MDIIETKDGPAVLEVNGNPGFKALEEVSGVDVAGSVIDLAVTKVNGMSYNRTPLTLRNESSYREKVTS